MSYALLMGTVWLWQHLKSLPDRFLHDTLTEDEIRVNSLAYLQDLIYSSAWIPTF